MYYTILLVEDEATERMALKYAVEKNYKDMKILEAGDGNEAVELFSRYQPEIMIVDINIPGITGLELIQTVRKQNQDTNILITTAYDKSAYIRRALEMGVLQYLLKPIHIGELKMAVDRCLERLKESSLEKARLRSLQQGIETVRSYAKEYLVQDILSGDAPEKVLQDACGWPKDGNLQLGLLCWYPEQEPDYDFFYEVCTKYLNPFFSLLFSPADQCGLLLMQTSSPREEAAVILFLRIQAEEIQKELGHGKIAATNFCSDYASLAEEWKKLPDKSEAIKDSMMLPKMPMRALGDNHKRVVLRQKILNRIRDGQTASLVSMLKKQMAGQDCYWPGAALFLEAFQMQDNTCGNELLQMFYQENSMELLSVWLENYKQENRKETDNKANYQSYAENAVQIIRRNYQKELTLTGVAEELGLSGPYFSNLFKQQTGKNFVTFLNEVRIEQAVFLMEQGESNMEKIAEHCGYYSKKYFFEAFKRVMGHPVTQHLQGERA